MHREDFGTTLPVWSVDDGRCGCGWKECKRPGKHADERAPASSASYAVITGERSGVFVVDVDTKGGVDGFAQLKEVSGGDIPDTFTVATPSKGAHIYFKHPGFHVGNAKLASAIDVRGDSDTERGMYVIGPGSPGYVKTEDPCVVVPAEPYRVISDVPIADAPVWLIGWLKSTVEERGDAFVPEAITPEHEHWASRVEKAIRWAKEMPPSRADGTGGTSLLSVCLRLVRTLELPVGTALDIIKEHFNPRCTDTSGNEYPWSDDDILHKLDDARTKSSIPCGLAEGVSALIVGRNKPAGVRDLLPKPKGRRRPKEGHTYQFKIGEITRNDGAEKVTFNALIEHYAKYPDWSGCWQFDTFADQVMVVDPPIALDAETRGLTDNDVSKLQSVLEFRDMLATEKDIKRAVHAAASACSFHPVREYLEGLPVGDLSIFQGLAKRLYGSDQEHADAFLEKTLVASVRRILDPGCQVDTVLILHGPEQGEGKTQSVEALYGKAWTRRGLPADLGNRDASHALWGFWAIELGEMTVLLRNESATIKDYLSRQVETYRQFGNGEKVKFARQCVFWGTTNDDDFLRDSTGNRRYWPISIPRGFDVPLAWIREHRDELWAAALVLAKDVDYRHWFTREEERSLHGARAPFIEADAWEGKVESFCKGKPFVKAQAVFEAVGGELKDFDRRKLLRITDSLKRLGCISVVKNGERVWEVPARLSSLSSEASQTSSSSYSERLSKNKDKNALS